MNEYLDEVKRWLDRASIITSILGFGTLFLVILIIRAEMYPLYTLIKNNIMDIIIGIGIFFIIGCIFGDYLQPNSVGGGWLWKGKKK